MTGSRLLKTLLRQNAVYYILAFIFTIFRTLTQFATPAILAELIDHHLGDAPSRFPPLLNRAFEAIFGAGFLGQNLWMFGMMIVLISVISGVAFYFRGTLTTKGSQNAARYLRNRMYDHIQHLPFDYHVKVETGDLLQRCTSDIDTIRRFLSDQVVSLMYSILMVVIALALMLPINAGITLMSLSITPAIFLFSMYFFRLVSQSFRRSDEAEAVMSTVLQENLTGVRVVRAFGQAQSEIEKFEAASAEHRKRGFKVARVEAVYWGLSGSLGNLQIVISLLVTILAALRGTITIGDMVLMTSYTSLLMWPIRQLGRVLTDSGKTRVALNRLVEVLNAQTEPAEPDAHKPPLNGDIEFDGVSFSYDKSRPVLQDVSFSVQPGQTVAILGPTGSGKSSLVHLLQRLYTPQEGQIRIGGVPLEQIDRTYLRQRVGLVLQDSFLYSKTIRENIAITAPGMEQPRIDRAAQTANALDFIQKSEKGYDTIVGERGVTLSGGQKQRVAIARTLLKDNDILIFDDSLSAVDTKTDAQIRDALLSGEHQVTTFIISHRISTLSRADLIVVLEDGRITDMGRHEELIARPGLYKRIYDIQSGDGLAPSSQEEVMA